SLVRRFGADIKGALIVDFSLTNIWNPVLSSGSGNDGYTYIVDSKGSLIAHPEAVFLKSHTDLSATAQVAKFLKQSETVGAPAFTLSEKNIQVMSAHVPIDQTGWAVITEIPVESIVAPANQAAKLAAFIFVFACITSLLL